MLRFRDNRFYSVDVDGTEKEVAPKARDQVDIMSSDVGVEAALLKFRLRLAGNTIEAIQDRGVYYIRKGNRHAQNDRS